MNADFDNGCLHDATQRRLRQFLLLIVAFAAGLIGPLIASAADRILTLDGVRIAMDQASTNVAIAYQSMRLNSTSNEWTIQVTVSNRSDGAVMGPLVLLIESASGTSGAVQPDGIDLGQPYFDLSWRLGGDGILGPSEVSSPFSLRLGAQAGVSPQIVARIFAPAARRPYALGLTRTLDEIGHPLPSVAVRESGPAGNLALESDPSLGVVTLGQGTGGHVWEFSSPGFLSVWRTQSLVSNAVASIPNPWMVRRSQDPVTITPGAGGVWSNAADTVRLTFGPNSFAGATAVTVTPLGAQTLPAFLPLGWSPLRICALEWNGALSASGQLRLVPSGQISFQEQAALVKWNAPGVRWETVATRPGNLNGSLTFPVNTPGTYALVVADEGEFAPPPAQAGTALAGAVRPAPALSNLTAIGEVTPFASAASRIPEFVTATATVTFSNPAALPSGVLLRCEVNDFYELQSSARLAPPRYETFVTAYQRPGDTNANTLSAAFPLRPVLLIESELARATVTAQVLLPEPFQGGVVDTNGGVVVAGSMQLLAGAGDPSGPRAVEFRELDPAAFSGLVQEPQQIVKAFEIQAQPLVGGRRFSVRFPSQATNATFVLARILTLDGRFGLEPVERFRSDAAGKLTSAEPTSGERLPGIMGAGQFVLVHTEAPQGILRGVVRNGNGTPASSVPVRVNGQPWLTFSGTNGSYRLLAPGGPGNLIIADAAGSGSRIFIFTIGDTSSGLTVDVSTTPSGPRLTKTTPPDGATNVSRVTPIVVDFTKAVLPATLLGGGLRLLAPDGQPVAGSLSLNLANTAATFLPNDELAPDAVFQIVVSTNVADRDGRLLEGPSVARFRTLPAPLDRTGGTLRSYAPVNGQAVLLGGPGTAESRSSVILVNETSGRTTTVISGADGSFSNSIPAEVDDTLSAVVVNQNGTRNSVSVSRQIFPDGSVGLFNTGGTLEVTNENGACQFIVEPGAIETKTIFKVEALSLLETRTLLGNVQPTNGMVLGGFKVAGIQGSSLRQPMDLNMPVNPAVFPPGLNPTNASFGLAIARVIEGQQVFEFIDSMHYEAGRLVTHSPPHPGLINFPSDIVVAPLLLSSEPAAVVYGRVYSARVDSNNKEVGSPDDLAGAIVTSGGRINGLAPGQLARGTVFAVSSTNGHYSLLATRTTLSATHPRFPLKVAEGVIPVPATNLNEVNLRFSIPETASDIPPELIVTHLPKRQDPGGTITNTIIARGNGSPATIEPPRFRSALSLTPGETVKESDVIITELNSAQPLDPPVPFAVTQRFAVTCSNAAVVDLLFSAADGNGNKTTLPYTVLFSPRIPDPPSGPIPGSDFHDRTGPRVLWSVPEAKDGALNAGDAISIKFNETIKTNILQQSAAFTIVPLCKPPIVTLSDDQTVLSLFYFDLQPGTTYTLTVKSVEDLYGNFMDQNPFQPGDQPYILSFTAGALAGGELSNPGAPLNEGVAAVANGHYGFVLERSPTTNGLFVYDLRTAQAPPVAVRNLPFQPRDLALIPHYSFYYAPPSLYQDPVLRRQVTTNDITEILIRDLLAIVGGIPGQTSILRVYDVTDPVHPELLAGTELSRGETLASRVRWSAPLLGLLEVGQPDLVTTVNLQSFLLGKLLAENSSANTNFAKSLPGRDDNLDGDYTDPGDELPWPASKPAGFYGRQGSFGVGDSTQPIREFAIEDRGDFRGAIVLAGHRLDEDGKIPCADLNDAQCKISAGYRTLANDGVPVFLDEGFYAVSNGSPRRLLTLFKYPITAGTNTSFYDLALISVNSPPADPTNHVLVLNLTNRLKPELLLDIPIPRSAGTTNLYSIVRRDDGLLVLASDTNSFLIDPARFGAAIVDTNKARFSVVGMIPGIGGDPWTFGISDAGAVVSGRMPLRPHVVLTPPAIEIVSFPEVDPFDPHDWLATLVPNSAVSNILRRLEGREHADSLRLARYRAEDGYCNSTLKDLTDPGARSTHYYVVIKTMAGDPNRPYIDLALESLNWAGSPLKKRGFLFPPVHAFSPDALKPSNLDQVPAPNEDAEVRPCRAWRLSDDPSQALYDVYLSRPFALVGESLSRDELKQLDDALERDILWSGDFLRVTIDPAEAFNPDLKPFAGMIKDGRYHPGVFRTLPSLPGEFIQSPNPMPIRGGVTIGLAGGMVGAHNSELIVDTVDMSIPGRRLPVAFSRHYSGQALHHGPFGRGWNFNFNQRLVELSKDLVVHGYTNPVVVRGNVNDSEFAISRDVLFYNAAGRTIVYKWSGTNPPTEVATDKLVERLGWVDSSSQAATNVSDYYLPPAGVFSPLFKFRDGRFSMLDPDGTQHWFNSSGRLIARYDRWETNSIDLSYGDEGELIAIRSDGGERDPDKRFQLEIGYYRNPQCGPLWPADVATNVTSIVGRVGRLRDYTRREVSFGYNQSGDLAARRGINVATDYSGTGYGKTGSSFTSYFYSDALHPDVSQKSLIEIRGPNPETGLGDVPLVKVEQPAAAGPDTIKQIRLGDKLLIELDQAYPNTARGMATTTPRQVISKGPIVTTSAGTVQSTLTYNFYKEGRPEDIAVAGGAAVPCVTHTVYDTNGLPVEVRLPELNLIQYTYSPDAPNLRARANLKKTSRNPGPRPLLPPSISTEMKFAYDEDYYNLPEGDQFDFIGNKTTIALSGDKRAVTSTTKGLETEQYVLNEFGQMATNITALNIQTRIDYTPAGFPEYQRVELLGGSDPPLETHSEYQGAAGLRGLPSKVTDPSGIETLLHYDELDRLGKRVRSAAEETFSFDLAGNHIESTRIVEVSGPNGPRIKTDHFYYDDFGHVQSNRTEGVEVFNSPGDPQPQSKPVATHYQRDAYYRVTKTISPGGESVETEYDFASRPVSSTLKANGTERYKKVLHYDLNGNVLDEGVQDLHTVTKYDGFDRPFEISTSAGAKTALTYDNNGNLKTSETTDKGSGKLLRSSEMTYDALDRVKSVTKATETAPTILTITYDTPNRQVIYKNSRGAQSTNIMESPGRKWTSVGPFGSHTTTFDPQLRKMTETRTDQIGPVPTTTQFDELMHTKSVDLAGGQTYGFSPEVDGRVVNVSIPGPTGGNFGAKHTLDGLVVEASKPEGQTLVSRFDGRRATILEAPRFEDGSARGTTYSYDLAGFSTGAKDALQKGDDYHDFDLYGHPKIIDIAAGAQLGLTYDNFGRVTSANYTQGSQSNPSLPHFQYGYDALNRVTSIENNSGKITYEYGKDGLPKAVRITQSGVTRSLISAYNREGARTLLTYSDGLDVVFDRDDSGRLLAVRPAIGVPVVTLSSADYHVGTLPAHRIMGGGLVEMLIQYDENRRETNRLYRVNGPTVVEIGVGYQLDPLGQITARRLLHAHTTDYYRYDHSQRLVGAVIGVTNASPPALGVIPSGAYGRTFFYDIKDVMVSAPLQNPGAIAVPAFGVTVPAGAIDDNLFVTQCTYPGTTPVSITRGVDAAGNTLTSRGFVRPRAEPSSQLYPTNGFIPINVTYTYNELDQLVRVVRADGVTISNAYGPDGLRIRRTVQGPVNLTIPSDLEYVYDGANLIEIRDFARGRELRARFYYGDLGDELLAGDFFDPGSSIPKRYYYLTDKLGSPMAIVDALGNVVEYYQYEPWGEATIRPPGGGYWSLTPSAQGIHTRSAIGSPFYFQGQIYDEDAGLIYMRARFYDPGMGVFLQRDPSGYKDSGNRCLGLAGNPVNLRDPSGCTAAPLFSAAGAEAAYWRGSEQPDRRRGLYNLHPERFSAKEAWHLWTRTTIPIQDILDHTSGNDNEDWRVRTLGFFSAKRWYQTFEQLFVPGVPVDKRALVRASGLTAEIAGYLLQVEMGGHGLRGPRLEPAYSAATSSAYPVAAQEPALLAQSLNIFKGAGAKQLPSEPGGTGSGYDTEKGQGIYALIDENFHVKYIGRGDAPARITMHSMTPLKDDLQYVILWENNLAKAQAKGLEQRLIDQFGGSLSQNSKTPLLNRIRSFAAENPNATAYRNAVSEELWDETMSRIRTLVK